MNEKTIITILLALVAMAGQAKTYKTIKAPEWMACVNVIGDGLKASEVVFRDTATTVHFSMEYPKGQYFRFGVQRWREEVERLHLPWPQLMPVPDTNPRNALAAYGIRSYPELIVIDSKGTIVACPRNVEELGSVLNKLKTK